MAKPLPPTTPLRALRDRVAKFANEAEGRRVADELDEGRIYGISSEDPHLPNYRASEELMKDSHARTPGDLLQRTAPFDPEAPQVNPQVRGDRKVGWYEDDMEVLQAPEGYEGRSVEDIRKKYKADAHGPTIGDEAAAELTSRFDPEDIVRWRQNARNMIREGEDPTTVFSPKFLQALQRGAPKVARDSYDTGPPHLGLPAEGREEYFLRHKADKGLRDLEEEFPEEGE